MGKDNILKKFPSVRLTKPLWYNETVKLAPGRNYRGGGGELQVALICEYGGGQSFAASYLYKYARVASICRAAMVKYTGLVPRRSKPQREEYRVSSSSSPRWVASGPAQMQGVGSRSAPGAQP